MVTVRRKLGLFLLVGDWVGEMEMASKLRLRGLGAVVSGFLGVLRMVGRGFGRIAGVVASVVAVG